MQFLILYACQYNDKYVELYVSRMLGRMLHPMSPVVTQRACSAYVASFLSRAKYVKPLAVVSSLHHMVTWASAYVGNRESGTLQQQEEEERDGGVLSSTQHVWLPGAKQHETFYSVCQACFYVVCFVGMKYLTTETTDHRKREMREHVIHLLRNLPWVHVIFSPLNPLKYCLIDVRNEFVQVSRSTNILGTRQEELEIRVSHIETMGEEEDDEREIKMREGDGGRGSDREMNDMPLSSSSSSSSSLTKSSDDFVAGDNPLDSFFPYDPYLLSVSSSRVDPLYIVWSKNDEDDDDDDDDEDDDEDEGDDMNGRRGGETTGTAIEIPQARRRTNSFFATGGGDAGEDLFGSGAAWGGGDDTWEVEFDEENESHPMSLGDGSISPPDSFDGMEGSSYQASEGVGLQSFARPRIVSGSGSW